MTRGAWLKCHLVIRFQLGISFHTYPLLSVLAFILAADTLTCETRQNCPGDYCLVGDFCLI